MDSVGAWIWAAVVVGPVSMGFGWWMRSIQIPPGPELRTVDGMHLCPYPGMTDDDLEDYESSLSIPNPTFTRKCGRRYGMNREKFNSLKLRTPLCTAQRELLFYTEECVERMKTHTNPKTVYVMDDGEMILISLKDLMLNYAKPPQEVVNMTTAMDVAEDMKKEGLM